MSTTPPILVIGGEDDTPIRRALADIGRALVPGYDVDAIVTALRSLLAGRPLLDTAPRTDVIAGYSRDAQARALLTHLTGLSVT